MKVGSLIKFHRTKQGLTQQTLADGICSVPHLSKIENNSKEANEETIRLLLDRLSIDLQDVEKLEEEILSLIKDFADHMYYLEFEYMEMKFKSLRNKEELIPFTTQLYLYELYKARYYLLVQKPDKAESQLKWLNAHKQNFSQHELYLHSYISALVLALKGKVEDADEQLSHLIENSLMSSEMIGEVNYNFSVLKSTLNQFGPSIYYGKNALQQFKEDYNFKRIVLVQLLLAVNYSRAKMFNEAEEIYKHLIRNTKSLNMENYLPQIYHNMGDLYNRMNSFEKSIYYFGSAIKLLPEESELYILCLYNKGISEVLNGDEISGEKTFNELIRVASISGRQDYLVFSKYYLLRINNRDEEAMTYLEHKLIPYTRKNPNLKESFEHFSNILLEHFKDLGQFDKALKYMN